MIGTTIGNSLIWDNGTNVGIGNTNTSYTLDVSGSLRSTTSAYFATSSGNVAIGGTTANEKLQVAGAITATGTATTNFASSTTLDWYSSGGRILSRGANTTTVGTFSIQIQTSDASTVTNALSIASTGTATFINNVIVSNGNAIGAFTATGNASVGAGGNIRLNDTATTDSRDWAIGNAIGAGNYGDLVFTNGTSQGATPSSTKMVIKSAGNVGIGTSFVISPYLVGSQTGGVLQVATNVAKTATSNSYPVGFFGSNDATYPLGLYIGILTGSTTTARQVKLQGTEIGVSANSIVMQPDGGNVLIGLTSDSGRKLQVEGTNTPLLLHKTNNVSGSYCNIWQLGGSETNATSSYYLYCDTDFVGVRMVIYGNGNLANINGTYGTYSSDIRLKENIIPATSKLEDLMKLNVVNFNFKEDENKMKQIGFIAQEMQEVFPSFVYENDTRKYDEDGTVISGLEDSLGLKVGMEFAILVKAIQELKAEIEELKNK